MNPEHSSPTSDSYYHSRNTFLEKMRSFLLGHDIFISYARADALTYAPRLANRLGKLGFRCYLDQLDAPPSEKTSAKVLRALHRSSALVIVGTEKAATSDAVEEEVDFFSKLSRTILPIDVDGALAKARWRKSISGLPLGIESSSAVKSGRPSRQIINRIYDSAQFKRRNEQLRRAAFMVIGVIGLLIILGGGLSVFFGVKARTSTRLASDAEQKQKQALIAAEAATTLKDQAEKDLDEARQNLGTITGQLKTATEQTDTAKAAAKIAEERRAQSEQMARKQEAVAESIDLANTST